MNDPERVKTRLSPVEFAEKVSEKALGHSAVVMIPLGYWTMVTEAYGSPLMQRVEDEAIQVFPAREAITRELSFTIFERKK